MSENELTNAAAVAQEEESVTSPKYPSNDSKSEEQTEKTFSSVFPADDRSDVERTLSDLKQERKGSEEKPKRRNPFITALMIIFFPITGLVILTRKLFRKINLPLTAKMTMIYSIIFFLVLTGFTVFFIESVKRASGGNLRTFIVASVVLVVVVSALYAAMVWVTSQFMLKPIRTITSKIDEITDDNLSARIDQVDSQDELMELTTQINEMLASLEGSFLRQQNFVADASHELKTPISVIQGYSNMLRRWGKSDPVILEEGIDAISRESENMKKLVEQLLLLARLGNFSMNVTRFNLVEVVAELAESYKMVDFSHAIAFSREQDAITVATDKNLLTESVRALADNAIKYTPSGGKITLGCYMVDDHAEISVSDTGIGIKAEDLPHIFERFYRCDKARGRESGSSGLGLSIAKSIVETIGGKIEVKSEVGVGTTFVIKLY